MFFKINLILFCYLGLPATNAATHSLKYFYTGVSGDTSFPEFTAVGQVDGDQFFYFDSNTQKAIAAAEWFRDKEDAAYWERENQNMIREHQVFKGNIEIAKDRFNQTKSPGVHVNQVMYGCEWDDESGATDGFEQHGYDGEDFIALDLNNMRWIAPTPQAVITKLKLDQNTALLEYLKNYYTKECSDWLKKYLEYGKSTLQRKDAPEVSVFQQSSSSPLTCLATGFYPSGVMISWRKDGEDQHEDVDLGETLPNPDGTYQIRSTLTITPEQLKNHKYECVVDHKSLEKEMVKTLVTEPNDSSTGLIIGVAVVGLLVLICIVAGIILRKRKNNNNNKGFIPANSSDNGSDNSDSNPNVKVILM